jgi:uracil-DNA glycosylase
VKLDRATRAGLEAFGSLSEKRKEGQGENLAKSTKDVLVERSPEKRQAPMAGSSPAMPPLVTLDSPGKTKAERLAHLRERALGCQKCPHLVKFRQQVVFGVGNPEASLMFIGEAPGADEDRLGEPFVGRAGDLLTKMIVAMGLTREEIYIGNVLKCRPDMPESTPGNRKPTSEEMQTCLPYLLAQIEIIRPQVLIALGATAVEGVMGGKQTPISKLRGKFQDFRGIPLMPTFHPSYLLHNPSLAVKRQVWEDMLLAMELLKLPISEKQRGFFLTK